MLKKKMFIRILGVALSALIAALNYSPIMRLARTMPDSFFAQSVEELNLKIGGVSESYGLGRAAMVSASKDETLGEQTVSLKLFGLLSVKSVPAYVGEKCYLYPCGNAIGISIFTQGVLVVGNGSFTNASGRRCEPSKRAGLKPGDIIIEVSGMQVTTSEELQIALNANPAAAQLTIDREGKLHTIDVIPEAGADGNCRIGAWVRDSTVGIGTLSFMDADGNGITALGHAVIDSDTGTLIRVRDGEIVYATIVGIAKGLEGLPGELQGTFSDVSKRIGKITGNGELGIYGVADSSIEELKVNGAVPVAFPDEVHTGNASIYSTVDNGAVREYSCRIIKTSRQSEPGQKGLVVEITDERLLSATGGIVQGMSGSPIIQDGMLAGVITHVFINDPSKGYGAYAYWMYENMK